VPSLGISAVLCWAGVALVIDPSKRRAYRLFHASSFYLLIILLAVAVGTLVKLPERAGRAASRSDGCPPCAQAPAHRPYCDDAASDADGNHEHDLHT